jgi:hypothetical protein
MVMWQGHVTIAREKGEGDDAGQMIARSDTYCW